MLLGPIALVPLAIRPRGAVSMPSTKLECHWPMVQVGYITRFGLYGIYAPSGPSALGYNLYLSQARGMYGICDQIWENPPYGIFLINGTSLELTLLHFQDMQPTTHKLLNSKGIAMHVRVFSICT